MKTGLDPADRQGGRRPDRRARKARRPGPACYDFPPGYRWAFIYDGWDHIHRIIDRDGRVRTFLFR